MRRIVVSSLSLALAACSGGGKSVVADRGDCSAPASRALCLIGCNLGCTTTGCELTQIAQNQPLLLTFNQELDPTSVTTAAFQLKTANGEEPNGTWLVNGQVASFVPDLRVVGNQSFFGFKANESYVLSVRGGEGNDVARSTSGDRLPRSFTCNLAVSRGVVDLDGAPPKGRLESPASQQQVPRGVPIVFSFSEVLDPAPFIGTNSGTGPVQMRVRRTREAGEGRECDGDATAVEATYRLTADVLAARSVLTLMLPVELPGLACVELEVTSQVRDLAGVRAVPEVLRFYTEPSPPEPHERIEDFGTDTHFDRGGSGGVWGSNRAGPGWLGGDGRLGDFDWRHGRQLGPTSWEFSTDQQTIPRNATQSGIDELVTDGVFRYASFVLPQGIRVRFAGRNPVRLFVRGRVLVAGELELSAADQPAHSGGPLGQPGGGGGAGGGSGGRGADAGDGLEPGFDGRPGEDVRLLAGHAYSGRAGATGGAGSRQNPADGSSAEVRRRATAPNENWFGFVMTTAAGGGGGGNAARAGDGTVRAVVTNLAQDRGPDASGGRAFDPFPLVAGPSTVDQLLIGGAGGGGGASVPTFSTLLQVLWRSGAGGAGGGGAFGLRAGGDLVVGDGARIAVRGAAAARMQDDLNYPVPGGGGSGGAIVLQVAGSVSQLGLLDLRGGLGGENRVVTTQPLTLVHTTGGDGAGGRLRLEVVGSPSLDLLGRTEPPATAEAIAALRENDRDRVTGVRSLWYPTLQIFPPTFLRYEVEADVNDVRVRFSDDPARGQLANEGQAVRFLVQGGTLDSGGGLQPGSIQPFREYVGAGRGGASLDGDRRTAFRFVLLFDQAIAHSVAVRKVSVFFRT